MRFTSVLNSDFRVATLALWVLFVGNAFLIYMLVSWIPALMSQNDWAFGAASGAIVQFQVGGLAGGVIIATGMDRWHPCNALLTAYAVTAACLGAFSVLPDSPLAWGILFVLIGAGISGVHLTMNAIAAIIYPAEILAAGMGFTVAVARLGAVAAPLVGAVMIENELSVAAFMGVQLVPLALCAFAVMALRSRQLAAQ